MQARKVKRIWIVLMTAVMLLTSFFAVGCNGDPKKEKNGSDGSEGNVSGEFYNLEGAYKAGLLTMEDLMHICYFKEGVVRKEESESEYSEIEFVPNKETPILDEEKEEYIKQAFYEKCSDYFTDGQTIEDIEITGYYGEYNGNYVLNMRVEGLYGDTSVTTYTVGGLIFTGLGATEFIKVFSID